MIQWLKSLISIYCLLNALEGNKVNLLKVFKQLVALMLIFWFMKEFRKRQLNLNLVIKNKNKKLCQSLSVK